MRNLRRAFWAAGLALVAAAGPASAQFNTGSGQTLNSAGANTGNVLGGNTGNTGTTSTSGLQGSTTIPGASNNVAGNLANSYQQFQNAQQLIPPSQANMTSSLSTGNLLGRYYASPLYQGSNVSYVPNGVPGGFGAVTFSATGGTTGGRGGAATATQGGRGATGTVNSADPGGQIVQLPRQIAYSSQVQFKLPAGNPVPQLQSDLRSSIDRIPASVLANPAGVKVEVQERNVVLSGSVKDEEEARLVEGLVRLTPGVYSIKNELTFAK